MNNLAAASAFLQSARPRRGRPPILSPEEREAVRTRFANGEKAADLAKAFNVSPKTIYTITGD